MDFPFGLWNRQLLAYAIICNKNIAKHPALHWLCHNTQGGSQFPLEPRLYCRWAYDSGVAKWGQPRFRRSVYHH